MIDAVRKVFFKCKEVIGMFLTQQRGGLAVCDEVRGCVQALLAQVLSVVSLVREEATSDRSGE